MEKKLMEFLFSISQLDYIQGKCKELSIANKRLKTTKFVRCENVREGVTYEKQLESIHRMEKELMDLIQNSSLAHKFSVYAKSNINYEFINDNIYDILLKNRFSWANQIAFELCYSLFLIHIMDKIKDEKAKYNFIYGMVFNGEIQKKFKVLSKYELLFYYVKEFLTEIDEEKVIAMKEETNELIEEVNNSSVSMFVRQ